MLLKDFVKNSIMSVYEGIKESNQKLDSSKINIAFEVFVSVADKDDTNKGVSGGINVSVFNLGASKKSSQTSENSAYNKLTFNIDVYASDLTAPTPPLKVKDSSDYNFIGD